MTHENTSSPVPRGRSGPGTRPKAGMLPSTIASKGNCSSSTDSFAASIDHRQGYGRRRVRAQPAGLQDCSRDASRVAAATTVGESGYRSATETGLHSMRASFYGSWWDYLARPSSARASKPFISYQADFQNAVGKVIAGNIRDQGRARRALDRCRRAEAIKVGIRPGLICTTRIRRRVSALRRAHRDHGMRSKPPRKAGQSRDR